MKTKQERPQRRLLGGESAVEGIIIIIIIKQIYPAVCLSFKDRLQSNHWRVFFNVINSFVARHGPLSSAVPA